MALRHGLPEFRPSLDPPVAEERILPRMPRPATVEFRSGSDMREVVRAIESNKSLHVDAAVGAGKSTVLPYKIADAMQVLVMQVFPNPYLASDVSDYCRANGKQSYFVEDAMEEFPETGVVCVSASVLVARWLQSGEPVMPRCVVFHDESHESDAYTYLVKSICSSLKTVRSYVTATATSVGGGFRQMETEGKVIDHILPMSAFRSEWDVYSDDPWGVEALEGHMLVFEESKSKADDLAQRYRYAGMNVYRFHSRMDIKQFRQAMAEMRDPSSPLVVIIADYAFRSGLTLPVSRIVDTAEVYNVVVEGGKPVRKIRMAYEAELYQGRARGAARMPGRVTEYYRPEYDAQTFICDLEASEVDAAALLFRLMGYAVPRQLAGATTVTGDVPRNLPLALRGFMPLACLQPSQKLPMHEFFSASGRRSPFLREGFEVNPAPADLLNNSISADTARKYDQGGIRPVVRGIPEVINRWEDDYREDSSRRDSACDVVPAAASVEPLSVSKKETSNQFDHATQMRAVADTINAFTGYDDSVDGIEVGHYYYATGLFSNALTSSAFPEGYVSVCRWLAKDHSETRHYGLSDVERSVAVGALLSRYNTRTCEMRVLTYAIPQVKERAVGKDLGAVRKWATDMSESVVEILADLRVLSKYILRVARGFCGLSEMQPLVDLEEDGKRRVVRQIDELPKASLGPPAGFVDDLRKQWDAVAIGRASTVSDSSSDYGYRQLEEVPMPTTGKGMRAIAGPASEMRYGKKKSGSGEFSIRKEGRRYSLVRR